MSTVLADDEDVKATQKIHIHLGANANTKNENDLYNVRAYMLDRLKVDQVFNSFVFWLVSYISILIFVVYKTNNIYYWYMQLMGFEENCEDVDDEECLRRRMTAEAHLDYIYTQRQAHRHKDKNNTTSTPPGLNTP